MAPLFSQFDTKAALRPAMPPMQSVPEMLPLLRHPVMAMRPEMCIRDRTKEELEQVMEEFAAGELDVLVATTIIESGIDNPHTNTLIIEDAQRLSLIHI